MKKVPVEQAIGLSLGHDIMGIDPQSGVKSTAFFRGHRIEAADVALLKNLGKNHIYADNDGSSDAVHEDDFALAVISRIGDPDTISHDTKPVQGRLGLYARSTGVLCIDSQRLFRLHEQHGEIALPTLPQYYAVKAEDRVAAFRILPLFAPRDTLQSTLNILDTPLIRIAPYRVTKAAVLVTGSEVYEGRIQDRFLPLLTRKLGAFGVEIVHHQLLPDDRQHIASALAEAYAKAELVCITGGTSVDPDDVTIAAVCDSGAVPLRRGVPAQPGNNFTIAYEHTRTIPVLTIPAGALSTPITTLDIYLPRLLAGLPIHKRELDHASLGGLCQQCPTCHFPNCTFGGVR
ncbi:hypothetical protein LGV61_00510 [Desulfurispirillum indicum]|uniref:Molybdopterin binding domain n=1 Tax=Desulfurispirillum indicum (strain ATCC BAA-1389 / DSM 22839 / S5) TaxID=653733 RepID=E6W5C7_DESIS|nr:molybdopterin-binding protein [Desulfurispirillum indicum]ADU64858.1 molybdopterin binding domain [Desulfurispirillum indicum S5]UCZ56789.1 hypothetical protein LGV61_00510 [Desulfurispirillum indicum]